MIWENGNCIKILETLEEIWDMIVQDEILITCRHMDLVINVVSLRGMLKKLHFKPKISLLANTFTTCLPLMLLQTTKSFTASKAFYPEKVL